MKINMRKICRVTLPMVCLLCLTAFGAAAGVEGTNGSSDAARIVARQDYDSTADQIPQQIMGRRFWNLLPGDWRNKSDPKPLPTKKALASQGRMVHSSEPMLREAARWYSRKNLLVPDTNNSLAISAARLNEAEFDPKVPFILGGGGSRPHFRCMDDFKVDDKEYKKWKKEHPNFLGFAAGDEYDSDYIGALHQTNVLEYVKRLRAQNYSEAMITQATNILVNARKGRDQALAGSYACFKAAQRYYFNDPAKMIFLHSGWCWDHYPLEWGAGMVILETSSTGPYRYQVAMSFARGAARQYGKPWEWYIAVCYNGFTEDGKWDDNAFPYCLTTNTTAFGIGDEHVRGPTCGPSISLNRRNMYLAYLAGASIVQHEGWPYTYWKFKNQDARGDVELSPYGEAMKEWYAFTQWFPDRGSSYAPVAIMIPFNQGYPQFGGRPWSYFPMERPDSMIDAFMYTLVPMAQNLKQGQEGCLANSPYGDIYDVVTPRPPSGPVALKTLMNYKVAIMLGGFNIDQALAKRLKEYVKKGGTLVLNTRQVNDNLPDDFIGVRRTGKMCATEGKVNVVGGSDAITLPEPYDYEMLELKGAEPLWRDSKGGILASAHAYGRGRVVLTAVDYMVPRKSFCDNNDDTYIKAMKSREHPLVQILMRQIVKDVLPVEVKGDIEYGLNKVSDGWWVYLINNKGVTKFTRTPEKADVAQTAKVTVDMRSLTPIMVQELREGTDMAWDKNKNSFSIDVGPGDIKVLEITLAEKY